MLFPEVVRILIDRDATRTPATLDGWQVIALPDQPYPTIITSAGGVADGQLFTDLSIAEWNALDAFEAPGYALNRVDTSSGPAYIYASPQDHGLTPAPWDVEAFRAEQLPNYLDRCRAWRQRYDAQQ
nr:gamma-glutamylcyclotransferase family protein [Kineosporia mesophila]